MMEMYRCLECQEVFVAEKDPPRELLLPEEAVAAEIEVAAHRTHRTELLRPVRGSSWSWSRDPYDASHRTIYLSVSNGSDRFLVVKRRSGLANPFRYELRTGKVQELPPVMRLREEDLVKQIVWEKRGDCPAVEEIAQFIIAFKELLEPLSPADLGQEVADLRHPLVSYARPGDGFFRELAAQVCRRVTAKAALWFQEFVNRHQDLPSPLEVEIRRDFQVALDEQSPPVMTAARSGAVLS